MGTNYYVKIADDVELHVGKSSAGWCFSLHVIPEQHLNSLVDWILLFLSYPDSIYSEYGDQISPRQMILRITSRVGSAQEPTQSFLTRNRAFLGPKNLLRHRLSDHCIGHGEGTWDYIAGEFS